VRGSASLSQFDLGAKPFNAIFSPFARLFLRASTFALKMCDAGEQSAWTKAKNTIRCQGERL
jgi:hypothetical protein